MLLHCYRCEIFLGFYLYGVRTNYGVRSGGRGGGDSGYAREGGECNGDLSPSLLVLETKRIFGRLKSVWQE